MLRSRVREYPSMHSGLLSISRFWFQSCHLSPSSCKLSTLPNCPSFFKVSPCSESPFSPYTSVQSETPHAAVDSEQLCIERSVIHLIMDNIAYTIQRHTGSSEFSKCFVPFWSFQDYNCIQSGCKSPYHPNMTPVLTWSFKSKNIYKLLKWRKTKRRKPYCKSVTTDFLAEIIWLNKPHRAVPYILDLFIVAHIVDNGLKCLNRINTLTPNLGSEAIQNHHETV